MYGASVKVVYSGAAFLTLLLVCIECAKLTATPDSERSSEDILYHITYGNVEEGYKAAEKGLLFKPRTRGYERSVFVRSYPQNGTDDTSPIEGVALRRGSKDCDFQNDTVFAIVEGGLGENYLKLEITSFNPSSCSFLYFIFTKNSISES